MSHLATVDWSTFQGAGDLVRRQPARPLRQRHAIDVAVDHRRPAGDLRHGIMGRGDKQHG
jgi:hypothetical protein